MEAIMNGMNITLIDGIIIGFIIIHMFLGWKKGLILSLANFFGIIVAFFLSRKFFVAFGELLNKNITWVKGFEESMVIKINESFASNSEVFTDLSDGTFLKQLDLPEYLNIGIGQMVRDLDLTQTESINTKLAEIIVQVIMNFISFVLLFILIILAIKFLALVLNMFFQLPILKGINKFGGLLMGFVIGQVFIYLFMTVMLLLEPMNLDFGIVSSIKESTLGLFYYNNNLLFVLINYYL
jgi:uncharacterized membrane protein required for colicin V production